MPEVPKQGKKVSFYNMVQFYLVLMKEKLVSLFKFESEELRERMRVSLPEKAVAIDQTCKPNNTGKGMYRSTFSTGFESALDMKLEPFELSEGTTSICERN